MREPVHADDWATLYLGDCLDVMAEMPENSVDTIICDPPYGLGFMGKDWDHGVPGVHFWEAALRVAKPGAMLLAFGGTRTVHRLTCAIEDAGWEIRDALCWMYGSGFPKSHDIAKAIDRKNGVEREDRFGGAFSDGRSHRGGNKKCEACGKWLISSTDRCQCPRKDNAVSPEAKLWDGFGTALKPAYEPIVLAMKPLDGTFAENALKHGVAGLNIDGARIEGPKAGGSGGAPLQFAGTNHRPFHDDKKPREFDQSPGRWPANVILSHTPDCMLVGTKQVDGITIGCKPGQESARDHGTYGMKAGGHDYADPDGKETVEDWRCADDCPVRLLDEQAGDCSVTGVRSKRSQDAIVVGTQWGTNNHKSVEYANDRGGPSRFYYCAKAGRSEREDGCHELPVKPLNWSSGEQSPGTFQSENTNRNVRNVHPTVKPIDVMTWLCKLTSTPTGGVILDPFMGSGTTGIAASLTNRKFIGIEIDPQYMEIAKARLTKVARQPELFT